MLFQKRVCRAVNTETPVIESPQESSEGSVSPWCFTPPDLLLREMLDTRQGLLHGNIPSRWELGMCLCPPHLLSHGYTNSRWLVKPFELTKPKAQPVSDRWKSSKYQLKPSLKQAVFSFFETFKTMQEICFHSMPSARPCINFCFSSSRTLLSSLLIFCFRTLLS